MVHVYHFTIFYHTLPGMFHIYIYLPSFSHRKHRRNDGFPTLKLDGFQRSNPGRPGDRIFQQKSVNSPQ